MFINNIRSNNVYVYQSWENLGTIDVSSRTGFISATYKKVKKKKKKIANYRPISLIFRWNNFLFLNIIYIILHSGHFRNSETNQLLSKKELYYTQFTHTNSLSEQLAVISLDFFSQSGLGFFLCLPCLVTGANSFISLKLVIPISNLKLE